MKPLQRHHDGPAWPGRQLPTTTARCGTEDFAPSILILPRQTSNRGDTSHGRSVGSRVFGSAGWLIFPAQLGDAGCEDGPRVNVDRELAVLDGMARPAALVRVPSYGIGSSAGRDSSRICFRSLMAHPWTSARRYANGVSKLGCSI